MAFAGKEAGVNNTGKKQIKQLMEAGYGAVEISDRLQVVLSCIVSFMKHYGATDAQLGDLTEKPEGEAAIALANSQAALNRAADEIDGNKSEIERLRGLLEDNEIEHEIDLEDSGD